MTGCHSCSVSGLVGGSRQVRWWSGSRAARRQQTVALLMSDQDRSSRRTGEVDVKSSECYHSYSLVQLKNRHCYNYCQQFDL